MGSTKSLIVAALEAELKPLKKMGKCRVLQKSGLFQFGVVSSQEKELYFLRTGMGCKRVEQAFAWLAEFFLPEKILHIGTCGGFDPNLKCGDLLFAESVLRADVVWQTDLVLTEKLFRACERERMEPQRVVLYTADQVIASVAHKAELWRKTAAAAVDMESAAVLEFGFNHNIPVAVARVVWDSAHDMMPDIFDTLDAVGNVYPLKFARKLLLHPSLIKELPSLAQKLKLCQRVLKQVLQDAFMVEDLFREIS